MTPDPSPTGIPLTDEELADLRSALNPPHKEELYGADILAGCLATIDSLTERLTLAEGALQRIAAGKCRRPDHRFHSCRKEWPEIDANWCDTCIARQVIHPRFSPPTTEGTTSE